MKVALVVGNTETGSIQGISGAGHAPGATEMTPVADTEIVRFGEPVFAPEVPVSPTGCPSPALITRAVRELIEFDLFTVDAGLASRTAAPVFQTASRPGRDVREPTAVPAVEDIYQRAYDVGGALPDAQVAIAESIPGGTTTALGVLRALGEEYAVSSSLPDNPLELKRDIIARGLDASGFSTGAAAGDPMKALSAMGDPVLATILGMAAGACEAGTDVSLYGGSQMIAVAALLRHAGVSEEMRIATTSYVTDDASVGLQTAADELQIRLRVTEPHFGQSDHPALAGFGKGEAKEGVGMGGALWQASQEGVEMESVRERTIRLYDRLITNG